MQPRRTMGRRTLLFSPVLLLGQIKPPKIPGIRLPEINGQQFVKHTPALTTNLADVYEAVPGFENYHPGDAAALTLLPRNPAGDYLILPGLYEIVAESFCLKAGTNPPSRERGNFGSGYLYAPFKGPKAGQIERILRRSEDHPEVHQHDVQLLLWAIIAEQKLSECPKSIQRTAAILLDERDRRGLENDTLAVVPAPLRGKVYENLPPLIREGLEAENKMRELLAQKFRDATGAADELVESTTNPGQKVSSLYAQMETLAMRTGTLPEAGEKERVPWGQWSWHPDGFFIRIIPEGYPTSLRQLYYPERFTVQGQELIGPDGRRLRVTGNTVTLEQESRTVARALPLRDDVAALMSLRSAVFATEGEGNKARPVSDFLARAALSAIARGKRSAESEQAGTCAIRDSGFGGAGGGGAGMGRPGSQRLGQSRKPKENPNLERARNATNGIKQFGGMATKGLGAPLAMTGGLLDWQFSAASAVDQALNGENAPAVPLPGGQTPETCAEQERITLPRPRHTATGSEPPALIAARQALSDALATLMETGLARLQAEQRFAKEPTAPNGERLVALRHRWGVALVAVAEKGEALVAAFQKVGGRDARWTPEAWNAYIERLRTTGWTAAEKAEAQAVGVTERMLAEILQQRLRAERPEGDAAEQLVALCAALQATGRDYALLPAGREPEAVA